MLRKISLALLFLFSLTSYAPAWTGVVLSIPDANVIRVNLEYGEIIHVGFYGIALPEKDQPFGREAIQRVTILTYGKVVELGFADTKIEDPALNAELYGLSFALVREGDIIVNEELIRSGMAWVDPACFMPFCEEWKLLEYEAREARRGLWMDPDPIPPWEWRHYFSRYG